MREVYCGMPDGRWDGHPPHPPHSPAATRPCGPGAASASHLAMRLLPDLCYTLSEVCGLCGGDGCSAATVGRARGHHTQAAAHHAFPEGLPQKHPPQRPTERIGTDRRVQIFNLRARAEPFLSLEGCDASPRTNEAEEVPSRGGEGS